MHTSMVAGQWVWRRAPPPKETVCAPSLYHFFALRATDMRSSVRASEKGAQALPTPLLPPPQAESAMRLHAAPDPRTSRPGIVLASRSIRCINNRAAPCALVGSHTYTLGTGAVASTSTTCTAVVPHLKRQPTTMLCHTCSAHQEPMHQAQPNSTRNSGPFCKLAADCSGTRMRRRNACLLDSSVK